MATQTKQRNTVGILAALGVGAGALLFWRRTQVLNPNPSFEAGLDHWTVNDLSTIAPYPVAYGYRGQQSLFFNLAGGVFHTVQVMSEGIAIQPGQKLRISAMTRAVDLMRDQVATRAEAYVSTVLYGPDGVELGTVDSGPAHMGTYEWLLIQPPDFVVPAGAASARVFFGVDANAGQIWWDDVRLSRVVW